MLPRGVQMCHRRKSVWDDKHRNAAGSVSISCSPLANDHRPALASSDTPSNNSRRDERRRAYLQHLDLTYVHDVAERTCSRSVSRDNDMFIDGDALGPQGATPVRRFLGMVLERDGPHPRTRLAVIRVRLSMEPIWRSQSSRRGGPTGRRYVRFADGAIHSVNVRASKALSSSGLSCEMDSTLKHQRKSRRC